MCREVHGIRERTLEVRVVERLNRLAVEIAA